MTLRKAIPIRNAATTPLDGRLADMGQVVCNSDRSPRVGVLGSASASIVSTTATTGTMTVTVAAAEFVTSKGVGDGVAIFANDGVVSVPIDAAPASNSRIDLIYVKHNDNTTGDATSDPVFGVLKGTAAASPVKPAIPANSGILELATLRIYSGTTATNGGANTLTNTYQMTAMRGGVVAFRTKAELDLWTNPTLGQEAAVGNVLYMRRSGAWRVASEDTGWQPITLGGTWTNFGGAYQNAEARKIDNVVFVEGLVKDGNPNVGQLIGTLPAGMWPKAYLMRNVWANGVARPVEIAPDGRIVVGDTSVSNLRTSFGFSFAVEP